MVFESRVGETFLLGASSWRIEQINHDRVLVSAAPGEPGKMPFWKADSIGRPLELGRAVGALVRTLVAMPPATAIERLVGQHDLDAQAAENLLRYLVGSDRGRRRRARRPHGPHRALPGRARRLACLRPLALWQPHPRPVGNGRR